MLDLLFLTLLRSGLYKKKVTVAPVFMKYCKIKRALCWCALTGKGLELALRSHFVEILAVDKKRMKTSLRSQMGQ